MGTKHKRKLISVFATGSGGNCYLLQKDGHFILLECGIAFKQIQQHLAYRVHRLAACMITHEHSDHARAAVSLTRFGVELYASAGTHKKYRHLVEPNRLHIIDPVHPVELGPWIVDAYSVKHDAEDPLCFMFNSSDERILFLTDSGIIPAAASKALHRACKEDSKPLHLMIECNHCEELIRENTELESAIKQRILDTHLSIQSLTMWFKHIPKTTLDLIQETHLLHLSPGNGDAERFKLRIQELTGKPVYVAESS